jgi:SOS-response transcriptional repressor LexA|tara:strand:+ start:175 stop:516 length:342 start_codon:yes stop_codon:yes gene_type:complete
MTPKQDECLQFLEKWFAEHRHAPSFKEIARGLNVNSGSRVFALLDALQAQGLVHREPHKWRSLRLTRGPLPWRRVGNAARRLVGNATLGSLSGKALVTIDDLNDLTTALKDAE